MSDSRLGIFGGTFDPPHLGHLIVARDAVDALALDRVLLVLSARPPHRSDAELTSVDLRLEMLEAAVGDDPVLVVSDLEARRPGPSYTIDTLSGLRRAHPGAELVLLIGVDQWRQLPTWHSAREIASLATVGVMERAGEIPVDNGLGITWRRCPVTRVDLSSTVIRERVREGRSIRHAVSEPVRQIIERNRLYATRDEPSRAASGVRHAS